MLRMACVALLLGASHGAACSGSVHVTVSRQISAVTRVSVTVERGDVSADLTRDPAGTFSGTFDVPPGMQTVIAKAWSGTRQVGIGSATAVVKPGRTVDVFIDVPDSAPPDHPPVITSLTASSNAVRVGDQVALAAVASDPDGDPLSFSWSASPAGCGTFASPASTATSWTAAAPGTCSLTVTVTANGQTASKGTDIVVSARTPALVQHVASSSNPKGIGIQGNGYRFYFPNPVGQGNCLILGITYPPGSGRTVAI